MKLTTITTGSKGNSYILQNKETRILLDAGATKKQLEEFIDISKISAVLITHEHGDHSKSVKLLVKRAKEVYLTQGTFDVLLEKDEELAHYRHRFNILKKNNGRYKSFLIGEFHIQPFKIEHDAREPIGFYFKHFDFYFAYITDTGTIPGFVNINTMLIECNHQYKYLKEAEDFRINRVQKTHLSLETLTNYFTQLNNPDIRLLLCHYSDQNSNPKECVEQLKTLQKYVSFVKDKTSVFL